MKERIVIDVQEYCKQCKKQSCRTEYCWLKRKKDEGRFEQEPETFEELKELCKPICKTTVDLEGNIRLFRLFDENDEQVTDVFRFKKDGTIIVGDTRNEYWIAKNRTPQQMWNIIKSLIGEE